MNRRHFLSLLPVIPLLGHLPKAQAGVAKFDFKGKELEIKILPEGPTRQEYEWVCGPFKTQPSRRARLNTTHDPREELTLEEYGEPQVAIWGQVRRWNGDVFDWAMMYHAEPVNSPEEHLAHLTNLWPRAKDWSELIRHDARHDMKPCLKGFESGIIYDLGQVPLDYQATTDSNSVAQGPTMID